MKKGRTMIPLLAGILVGALLVGPVAGAVEDFLKATPSVQKFYVDGQQVEMEAYAIEGYNYVKLRDIGRMVGFDVSYDAATDSALITTGMAYVDDEVPAPVPAPQPIEAADYAAQANPAIFKGELTRAAYNGIRGSVLNRDSILAGAVEPAAFQADLSYDSQLRNAAAMLGQYPKYSLDAVEVGKYRCNVQELEVYAPAVEHTQSFVDSLSGLAQKEQATQIAWYVCDRLTYAREYPFVDEVLSQDGQVRGCCMAYAYCFQFLCDRVGIPCILIASETHQWNQVYIDGKWWAVDVTGLDLGNEVDARPKLTVLNEPAALRGAIFADCDPESTVFAKELLIPGSTK